MQSYCAHKCSGLQSAYIFAPHLVLGELHLNEWLHSSEELPPQPVLDTSVFLDVFLDASNCQILNLLALQEVHRETCQCINESIIECMQCLTTVYLHCPVSLFCICVCLLGKNKLYEIIGVASISYHPRSLQFLLTAMQLCFTSKGRHNYENNIIVSPYHIVTNFICAIGICTVWGE